MNFKKSHFKTILTLLFVLSSIVGLNTIPFDVKAGPDIPMLHPNNGWHWGVDEGDQLYYETEFIITNASNGEVIVMFKDLWIYNITSIENVTLDYLGVNDFSQVNATQCFYNLTSAEIEAYDEPYEFALYGFNNSDTIKHKYRAGRSGTSMLLPLNGSNNLQVDIMDDILNESFYYPSGIATGHNQFDYYESDPVTNRILFSNSTDGYFTESFFYDDGTLNSANAYLTIWMNGPVYINATLKRVFDYNITNEVQWGVNVGDDIFYDFYEGIDWIDDAMDIKLHITDISPLMLEKNKNWFDINNPINMIFEVVWADIYGWNGTDYEILETDEPIGFANNLYPQYFDSMGPMLTFVYPSNVQREDFEFMWNNDTVKIWEIPFDEITYYENGYLRTVLKNTTGTAFADVSIDKTTGIVQSFLTHDEYNTMFYELKSQTLVDWSLGPGDTFYHKSNEDGQRDFRCTISGSYIVYTNMTYLAYLYSTIGVTIPIAGQPELQFFSYLEAEFEVWDTSSESWSFMGYDIICIANIYWPISPLVFEAGGPPLLVPENTVASDMDDFFVMFESIYDEITNPSSDTIILRNSTEDKSLYYHFDIPTGRVIMMHGWAKAPVPGSEWTFISSYTKKVETLSAGTNSFALESDFSLDISVNVEMNVTAGPTAEYIYSVFPYNPVNISLPNGTALVFFDQLITNYGQIDGNITFTIIFPSTIDLSQTELFFFAYNVSGSEEWNIVPPEFYDRIIYDFDANSITFPTEAWGPRGMISAFAYIDTSQVSYIPGYEPILVLGFSAIAILGIVSIYRKKYLK
ncbi:MAG: hypothetical protein ACFE96_11715 [Candidatus Hermodarchaeota archaeon]